MKNRNTLQDGRQGCAVVQVAGGVRSARWDSVGCVSMWWYMNIEGYILFFEILRIRVLSMSRFVLHSLRNKNKKKLTDGVGVC